MSFFCKKNNKRKIFFFCVNKFYGVVKIQKFDFCQNKKYVFWISEKKIQKNSFSFCFFLEVGWCFTLNKRWKNWKNECFIRFLQKKYFWVIENWQKKTDISENKKLLLKRVPCWKWWKKDFFFTCKNVCSNKGWSGWYDPTKKWKFEKNEKIRLV